MSADITLVFDALVRMPTAVALWFAALKQALYLPIVATQEHDIVAIIEVSHMDVGPYLSHWVMLQDFTKNLVDNVNEEGK